MALNINNDIYTGGYQVVDTRPHVQLYAQLKAREQARNDAFDEYMRNLNLKINPAGMRNQEREAFEEKLKNWQQKGIQNRDLIRNPRQDMGKAQMEFQADYQDLLNLAAESKTAAEGLKPFVDVATDPKKYNLLNKKRAMGAVQSHDQPILIKDETGQYVRNPNFRPFSPSELEFREEDFDIPKYLKSLDYIKPSEKMEEIVSTDPKTLMRKVRTTSKFKPEDYDKLASIGVQTYYSDPSMKQLVDQMFNDPKNKEVVKLNELFKSKFKTDIQNEGDLAAAMTIAGKETTEDEMKIEPDTFAQRKQLAALNDAYVRGRMAMRRAWQNADKETQGLWIQQNVTDKITAAKKPENRVEAKDRSGNWVASYSIPLDTYWRKAFSITVDGKTREPDDIRVTDDNKIIPVFYQYKDGKRVKKDGLEVLDYDLSVPHTLNDAIITLGGGAGVKQKNLEATSVYGEEGDDTGILD